MQFSNCNQIQRINKYADPWKLKFSSSSLIASNMNDVLLWYFIIIIIIIICSPIILYPYQVDTLHRPKNSIYIHSFLKFKHKYLTFYILFCMTSHNLYGKTQKSLNILNEYPFAVPKMYS